jgi:carbonic anhydrase
VIRGGASLAGGSDDLRTATCIARAGRGRKPRDKKNGAGGAHGRATSGANRSEHARGLGFDAAGFSVSPSRMHTSLRGWGAVVAAITLGGAALSASVPGAGPGAAEVLETLLAGNARFAAGEASRADRSPVRRGAVAGAQHPPAIVLTCSDSRVAPEIAFDQGLGELFVIRNAGNVLDPHVIGSIEYAVAHLGSSLILVVGHERCGAVAAAVAGGHAEGGVGEVVASITPSVEIARGLGGDDRVDVTVRAHARRVAELLRASGPVISEAVRAGRLRVAAARYDLDTGLVELLPEGEPAPAAAR